MIFKPRMHYLYFHAAGMYGYAVHASETFGVSRSIPGFLEVSGKVPRGAAPAFSLQPGQAALIHTGGMLPQNADAGVMLEQCELNRNGEMSSLRPGP